MSLRGGVFRISLSIGQHLEPVDNTVGVDVYLSHPTSRHTERLSYSSGDTIKVSFPDQKKKKIKNTLTVPYFLS